MIRPLLSIVALAALAYAWWRRLEPSERRYLSHIARQVPELPGRYAV